jgi:hypothetical protein
MKRRSFLGALAALPIVGKLVAPADKRAAAGAPPLREGWVSIKYVERITYEGERLWQWKRTILCDERGNLQVSALRPAQISAPTAVP